MMTIAPRFAPLRERLFAEPLDVSIERGDDVVARLRRNGDLLARPSCPVGVEGDVVLPDLALELIVEGLLEPLAALGVRPEQLVVFASTHPACRPARPA